MKKPKNKTKIPLREENLKEMEILLKFGQLSRRFHDYKQ